MHEKTAELHFVISRIVIAIHVVNLFGNVRNSKHNYVYVKLGKIENSKLATVVDISYVICSEEFEYIAGIQSFCDVLLELESSV